MVLVATRHCRYWGENYSAAVGFAVVHTGHVVATNSANGGRLYVDWIFARAEWTARCNLHIEVVPKVRAIV
jgi:hypothetical protein